MCEYSHTQGQVAVAEEPVQHSLKALVLRPCPRLISLAPHAELGGVQAEDGVGVVPPRYVGVGRDQAFGHCTIMTDIALNCHDPRPVEWRGRVVMVLSR